MDAPDDTGERDVDELRAAVHRDPRSAAEAASRVVTAARAGGDQGRLSAALAVRGRARRALGAIDLAKGDLLAAIDAAGAAGDDELAADAHLGLAGVYIYAGRSADAVAQLDLVQALGSERIRAYGSLQRAAVEQRVGRLREALAGYEAALPTLRDLDARVDIAIVLMNRGVIRTQLAECAAAIADLTEAGRLFAAEENGYGVAQTQHGLGWAHARRGDLATALAWLDQATDGFRALGHTAGEVEVDRVEVLLAAGLFRAAAEAGHEVAVRLTAAGNHWFAAEAWLQCARAAVLSGDWTAGADQAERARALFAEHGSAAWERAARLELMRARLGGGQPADVAELRALASELDGAGNPRSAATALALAGVAAAEAGQVELAAALAGECARRAARLGLFEVRMQAAYAGARCAAARGDDASARRQIGRALADLRRHRGSIAAPDAQAAVAVHAEQLAALGRRLALRGGSAAVVLDWMERTRSDGPDGPAARPPDDAELALDLSELRSVVARERTAEADGRDPADLLRRQRQLERRIHRRQLCAPAAGRMPPKDPGLPVATLQSILDDRCLVELAEIDGRLVGVGVGATARPRLADLGPSAEARAAAAAGLSALRTLLARSGAPSGARARSGAAGARSGAGVRSGARASRLGVLRRALAALDRILAPLLTITPGDGPLVLVVPASLHAVPWSILPSLAGRPVSVAPSARWWCETTTAIPEPAPRVRALAVAGPRLVEAEREAVAVASCYPEAIILTGPAATTGAVSAALAGAAPRLDVAHLAGHGRIRDDNALWTSLELFDGPLYLYDLERLGRTPPLVVLSGCETGVGVRVGDELIGLSTVLLRHGTRHLVASLCPVPDSPATRAAMTALHQRIGGGASPAGALGPLSAGWAGDDEVALVAAALTCFGTH